MQVFENVGQRRLGWELKPRVLMEVLQKPAKAQRDVMHLSGTQLCQGSMDLVNVKVLRVQALLKSRSQKRGACCKDELSKAWLSRVSSVDLQWFHGAGSAGSP